MKSLKIVMFGGGLGNQMFQYCFYKSLKQYFDNVKADPFRCIDHNHYELERVFGININLSSRLENIIYGGDRRNLFTKVWSRICPLLNLCYWQKSPIYFDTNIFKDKTSKYYYGYWQNERYFDNITDLVKQEFSFKNPLIGKNARIKSLIENTNSVAIHVRKGDYVNFPIFNGICDVEYYRNAVDYISKNVEDATYFVFSNDIPWCKYNLGLANCHYIDWNKGEDSYIDMQLMSLCKHNIIANSTFSWWGAWLNSNPQKIVIAASKWMNEKEYKKEYKSNYDINDIIPKSWVCISS